MPVPSPRPRRRSTAAILVLSLLGSSLLADVAAAGRPPIKQRPRAGQVLVVAANLEEAWDPSDNADSGDLKTFVRRVDRLAPHAPDILLLQEVTSRAAKKVARLLKRKASKTYSVAVPAGSSPADVKKDKVVTRETAILINVRTMKRVGRRRYVDTSFAKRHGAQGLLREVTRNAVALVRERGTGITYPVASVHFHTGVSFVPTS